MITKRDEEKQHQHIHHFSSLHLRIVLFEKKEKNNLLDITNYICL